MDSQYGQVCVCVCVRCKPGQHFGGQTSHLLTPKHGHWTEEQHNTTYINLDDRRRSIVCVCRSIECTVHMRPLLCGQLHYSGFLFTAYFALHRLIG